MKVSLLKCPQCKVWLAVHPFKSQERRAKTCEYCDMTFVFANPDLVIREVPDVLGGRKYFKDSELK
jgi:hypothetical protein